MSVLVDSETRVICQGFTGRHGSRYTEQAVLYGTQVVGGVAPGRGGGVHLDLPVFSTVSQAVADTGADASMIFVPPSRAADAMIEAIEAELSTVVCVTAGVPVLDMVRVRHALKGSRTKLIGPNCPGVITPGECKIGIMPRHIFKRGKVGIISRSGTLIYEAVAQTTALDLGQSTCIGIGPDLLQGMSFPECIELFMEDEETEGIILIGTRGGTAETVAADYLRSNPATKPVVGYVAGRYAPPARRLGHAGVVVQHRLDVEEKCRILAEAGVQVVESPTAMGSEMARLLGST
jgi:succinyl-CoA synthetase alpha subunit